MSRTSAIAPPWAISQTRAASRSISVSGSSIARFLSKGNNSSSQSWRNARCLEVRD